MYSCVYCDSIVNYINSFSNLLPIYAVFILLSTFLNSFENQISLKTNHVWSNLVETFLTSFEEVSQMFKVLGQRSPFCHFGPTTNINPVMIFF